MASYTEVHTTVWIALLIIVFSLFYKLSLFALSPTYRSINSKVAKENMSMAALPSGMLLSSAYYGMQPTRNISNSTIQTTPLPDPMRYIMIYIAAIASCVFLLVSLQCSNTGSCETYAWIYVTYLAFMFVYIMSRMLYDYGSWRHLMRERKLKENKGATVK